MAPVERTSRIGWGMGCGIAAVVGLVAVGVGLFLGARLIGSQIADMQDPVKREARVKEVLGTHELPEGYHPRMALSLDRPTHLRVALLSSVPGLAGDLGFSPGPGEQHFTYLEAEPKQSDDAEALDEFIQGQASSAGAGRSFSLEANLKNTLARGRLQVGPHQITYASYLGPPAMFGGMPAGADPQAGASDAKSADRLNTLSQVRCTGSRWIRLAIWSAPVPEVAAAASGGLAPASGGSPVMAADVPATGPGLGGSSPQAVGQGVGIPDGAAQEGVEGGAAASPAPPTPPAPDAGSLEPRWRGTIADPAVLEAFFARVNLCVGG